MLHTKTWNLHVNIFQKNFSHAADIQFFGLFNFYTFSILLCWLSLQNVRKFELLELDQKIEYLLHEKSVSDDNMPVTFFEHSRSPNLFQKFYTNIAVACYQ